MQDVVQFGPLVFAADRLAAAIAIAAFLASTRFWRGLERPAAQNAAVLSVATGVLAARAAFVLQHLDSYALDPWSVLYVWQGGFDPVAGVFAAALVLPLLVEVRRSLVPLACLAVAGAAGIAATTTLDRRAIAPVPPGLAALTPDGRPLALDTLRGRPYVVNLWATWCPPCRRELPMLVEAATARGGVPILLVNQGEEPDVVHAYLDDAGLDPEAILLDPSATLGRGFGTPALPATLFVGADGTVRRRHYGEISRAALQDGLRLLRGNP